MANHRKTGNRFPNGKLKPQPKDDIAPYRMEDVVKKEERDGKKLVISYCHMGSSVLRKLRYRDFIKEIDLIAGEHFGFVWECFRSHYMGGPKPFPKVSRPERGFPGVEEPDFDRDPERWAKMYSSAVKHLRAQHEGDALAGIARSVCIFDVDPHQANLFRLKRSLQELAKHFGFARWL